MHPIVELSVPQSLASPVVPFSPFVLGSGFPYKVSLSSPEKGALVRKKSDVGQGCFR